MLISLILLISLIANTWLSWMLGNWQGVGIFLLSIPVIIILTIGGALALGLVSMMLSRSIYVSKSRRFFRGFFRGWAGLVSFVFLLPWILFGIIEFTNTHAPATLPRITITNGDKTVIFQSMMHIASPEFYTDIEADMRQLANEDYIFLYEGVKADSPESLEKLSTLMGTAVGEEMYIWMAQAAELTPQSAEKFTGILPSINTDLTTDEILQIARESKIPATEIPKIDLIEQLQKNYPNFTDFQKNITRTLSRGMLNIVLRSYTVPSFTDALLVSVPVMDVILNTRNKHLARAIIDSPSQHIYIQYGALHYDGVLKLLRENDNRWAEVSRKEIVVIR